MATQKRILLWTSPRCLSTVLMRSLSQLADSLVIHEYLLLANRNEYPDSLGVGTQATDLLDLQTDSDFNYQSWKALYEQPYPNKSFIVGKEFADSLGGRMEIIPDGYTHVFLIRRPRKTITSLEKSLENFTPEQKKVVMKPNQYRALAGIYDYVTQTLGQATPVVLDAADLLAKPADAVRLLCEATGMPFSRELLRWDKVADEPPDNWLVPKFMWAGIAKPMGMYRSAFESTCFHANRETSGAAKETDTIGPEIQQLIQDALPYYNELRQHRMVIQ